jgi:HAD superfamily hydrolase (TIGR01509 family)
LVVGIRHVPNLINGVSNFLDLLKTKSVKMAIGSSSPKEVVDYAVSHFNLDKWIEVVITGKDAENGKPSPDIYLKCAEILKVRPSECVVIEDSVNGIKSGKNAGMSVCSFAGTRHHNFDYSDADFEIKSYETSEIERFLKWAF